MRTRRSYLTGVTLLLSVVPTAACMHRGLTFDPGVRPIHSGSFGFAVRDGSAGLFTVAPELVGEVAVNRTHSLRLRVTDRQGRGIDDAVVTVDGGMPDHGHGLPTSPRVTADEGGGVYVVEGLRYHMPGWWVLQLRIDAGVGSDRVLFHLDL